MKHCTVFSNLQEKINKYTAYDTDFIVLFFLTKLKLNYRLKGFSFIKIININF